MMSDTVIPDASEADTAPEGEQEQPKDIDWKAEARKHEQRAKENAARAKANETAAQRLAEIEEASKTEAQKAADRLAAAEQRASELEARANRATAANTLGVPEALLAGPASSSAEDLAAFAEELIKFRGEQGGKRLLVPNEGKSPAPEPNSESEFVSELFGGGRD